MTPIKSRPERPYQRGIGKHSKTNTNPARTMKTIKQRTLDVLKRLKSHGFSATDLLELGATPEELVKIGYTPTELRLAGLIPQDPSKINLN